MTHPAATRVHAMVLGLDDQPRALPRDEIEAFGDYFTQHLILKGEVPLTLSELDAALQAVPDDARLKVRDLFAVAEGAHFVASDPPLSANERLVFTWRKDDASKPEVMLSTVAEPDDSTALMQLIAWSESDGAFHFFERKDGRWLWAGNSFHALEDETRGLGPFDSHVNGSLVMKELKFPWAHWHSQADSIPDRVLFPTPELKSHPLFLDVTNAEILENIVKGGVRRSTDRRLGKDSQGGAIERFERYTRQLVTTTTVNLVSSPKSNLAAAETVDLPASFFFDADGLTAALARLPDNTAVTTLKALNFSVSGEHYRAALSALGAHVSDGTSRADGDTHFAFLVPERAFEDLQVAQALMNANIVSPRLVLATLMVDFANPVFSSTRERLLRHFPERVTAGGDPAALDAAVVTAVREVAPETAPEAEFLRWWDDPDLGAAIRTAVDGYATAVQARLDDAAGVEDLLKLAEHRRAMFRSRRLNEFPQTLPKLDAAVAQLRMRPDGIVETLNGP